VEPVIPLSLVLGLFGGGLSAVLTLGKKFENVDNKMEEHVAALDRRIDSVELVLAKDFVPKTDLMVMMERIDDRIDRMDNKLDQLLIGYNKNAK
tara:strand:+ start:97 stop:378 length:282 start_codon:yes stop_codon:yes gene_type:complete